jgi:crossover junction endodeoxyribonuclease RuvC
MNIVGIDPGVTGALAWMFHGNLMRVDDMPINASRANGAEIAEWLRHIGPHVVYLEWTQPMPKNGSIASYSLGLNSGIIIGVVQALGISLERVRPAVWKTAMGLRGKPKSASRGMATELWPEFATMFRRVKDDGRAEAALIARYGAYKNIHTMTGSNEDGDSEDVDRAAGDRALRADHGTDRHPSAGTPGDQRPPARSGGGRPGIAEVRPFVRP